ncbi:MAG: YkgJ family cysteine cluster protein [Myxococcaceae bacterium]
MRDGLGLRVVKAIARVVKAIDLGLLRVFQRARGQQRYRLLGSCNGCGKCCEAPSIQVSKATWHLPNSRALFLLWQKMVNGFELTGTDARFRVFTFRCTHYDPVTKRCDSYDSRPLMCRDYPYLQTFEAIPRLFPECSHVVQDKKAEQLRAALVAAGVTGEKLDEAERRLFLKGLSAGAPTGEAQTEPDPQQKP